MLVLWDLSYSYHYKQLNEEVHFYPISLDFLSQGLVLQRSYKRPSCFNFCSSFSKKVYDVIVSLHMKICLHFFILKYFVDMWENLFIFCRMKYFVYIWNLSYHMKSFLHAGKIRFLYNLLTVREICLHIWLRAIAVLGMFLLLLLLVM